MTEENEEDKEVVKITEEDFLIRVSPIKTDEGEFTGEASFSVISSQDNEIPRALYDDLEYVVKCMLSTIPLMEQDEAFRDFVANYVENYFSYEFDERSDKPVVQGVDGNVITINFNTDTKGSA